MKTLKKTLCLVLAVVMVVGVLVLPANAAATTTEDTEATAAFDTLLGYGVMYGVDANNKPALDKNINRQDMAAIVYRIMTGDTKNQYVANYASAADEFADSATFATWAKGYIGYVRNQGIFVGDNLGNFKPTEEITGNDVLTVLLRCIGYGQNGEFTGANYAQNALTQATQIHMFGGVTGYKSVADKAMNKAISRGIVAKLTFNAVQAPMVTYFNGTYSAYSSQGRPVAPNAEGAKLNPSLIQLVPGKTTPSQDKWGVPTVKTEKTLYFNNPIPAVTIDKTTSSSKALKEYWDAVTECDVAHDLGIDGTHYATTYTNGIANVNLWNGNQLNTSTMPFQATDTVNKIGHEGRYFAVYEVPGFSGTESATNPKYIFVFKDAYLAKVTNVWGAETDPQSHVIKTAGASVNVFFNADAVGTGSTASLLSTATPLNLTIDGSYNVGDIIAVNMTNVLGTNPAANVANTTSTIQNEVTTLKTVSATITSITTDTNNSRIVGFVADGVQYYYNYTFAGTVLNGSNIGQTYTLWLGHDNDVLNYQLSGYTSGYGVTQTAVVKQINSNEYVVTYTILLPDGTTKTIDVVNNTGAVFADFDAAQTYANTTKPAGNLVHYTSAGKYYAFIENNDNVRLISDDSSKTVFESGRVEAADKNFPASAPVAGTAEGAAVNGAFVNDNTVFFVANYLPDTSTVTTNGGSDNLDKDYKMTGYSIYTGFQSIPDLAIADNSYLPDGQGSIEQVQHLTIQAFDVGADGMPVAAVANAYAKYVLITGATQQTTPPAKIAVRNYAFLLTNDSFKQETASSYIFGAIINGEAGKTLQVALASGIGIAEAGLYTYDNNINGQGYSDVYLMNSTGNTSLTAPYNADFEIDANTYTYAAGVLTAGTNYFTVANGCQVYRVNPTTGTSSTSTLGALAKDVYGTNSPIWYQLDEFGRINMIYIVETNTPDSGTPVSGSGSFSITAGGTATGPSAGDQQITVNVAMTSDGTLENGAYTASATIEYFSTGVGWTPFSTGTIAGVSFASGSATITTVTNTANFVAGSYRINIKVTAGGVTKETGNIYFTVSA